MALCFLGDTAGLQKGPAASFGESFASSINQGRQRARVVAALQNGGETWAELGRAARELPEAVRGDAHPRKRDVWGLDVRSLNTQGNWTFRFSIDGPQGHGVGELSNLTVLQHGTRAISRS